jgi:hypothetical protein
VVSVEIEKEKAAAQQAVKFVLPHAYTLAYCCIFVLTLRNFVLVAKPLPIRLTEILG